LMASISFETTSLIYLTIVLTVLNAFVKPFLQLISLPLTIMSLGFFYLIINAIVLSIAFTITNAGANSFFAIFIASILLSIINSMVSSFIGIEK